MKTPIIKETDKSKLDQISDMLCQYAGVSYHLDCSDISCGKCVLNDPYRNNHKEEIYELFIKLIES